MSSAATPTRIIDVGAIRVTVLSDGHMTLPKQMFTGLSAAEEVALPPAITVGANLWLIETGARTVLVDTGSGDTLRQMFPETGGALPFLAERPVTDIVLTHMHPDHIGGLKDDPFPEARIHVSDAEWLFWTAPGLADKVPLEKRDTVKLIQAIAAPLNSRVLRHEGKTDLGDGLTLVPLPGHTPGHSGLRIESAGERLFIVTDAVIAAEIHFAHPEAGYALDVDHDAVVTTRKALLTEAADAGTRIAACHLPFPGTGRVRREGSAFAFIAD